jgi:cell envelope-related transcriptional attenuator
MSAKQRAAKKRKKVIIFGIEIVVILFMVALLYLVMTHTSNEGPKVTVLETEELQIPEEVQQDETMKGYMNIALFGVDATKESLLYKGSRSDSIMIASINMDTGDIKLVSVYRDTYLNTGTDSYQKCNAAYSYGGAEQAVKMLNMNLDMDITNFVTVGYKGLSEVIDGLGGIYIDVDSEEIKHINNYQIGIAEVLKCDYTPVTETGMQLLNGLQATAYCRIRYTAGNDFKRAARQREVIQAIEDQAKKADYATLSKVFNSAIDDIYTSLDSKDILDLLGNISNYRIVDEGGFPEETMRDTGNIGAKGSCVIPVNLESNVVWLHQFLFDDANYSVTSNVKEYSNKIESDTSPYMNK